MESIGEKNMRSIQINFDELNNANNDKERIQGQRIEKQKR